MVLKSYDFTSEQILLFSSVSNKLREVEERIQFQLTG